MERFDVLIIGAGIVGSAAARECALAGLHVGIIESTIPAAGATAAGMGHVVVMDDSPAQLALTVYSRSLWLAESVKLPPAVEYKSRGTIWVAADDEEMAEVHAKTNTYAKAGVASQVLSPTNCAAWNQTSARASQVACWCRTMESAIHPPPQHFFLPRRNVWVRSSFLKSTLRREWRSADRERHDASAPTASCSPSALSATCFRHCPLRNAKDISSLRIAIPALSIISSSSLAISRAHTKSQQIPSPSTFNRALSGQLVIGSSRQYGSEDPAVEPAILKRDDGSRKGVHAEIERIYRSSANGQASEQRLSTSCR